MSGTVRSTLAGLHRAGLRLALERLSPARSIPLADVRRILVSGSMGIGNAVMLEPLLHALRRHFPQAHLAAAVRPRSPSRAVLEWPGLVDEVVVLQGGSRLAQIRSAVRLSRGEWDLYVIRFNGATYEFVTSAVLGRVPYRLGHITSGRFRSPDDWLFNLPVTMGSFDHEVDRYLGLAERLGHTPERRVPRLRVSDADRAAADELLQQSGVRPDATLVALQPGSSPHQTWKRWPVEHWQRLAAQLIQIGMVPVGLGSADERPLVARVCEAGGRNLAGSGSLRVAAAVLERCKLLVCTDGGLMHVAGAVGTPIVGVFGPTDRTRTRPYGPGHTLLTAPQCRSNLEPCLLPGGHLIPQCTWRECMPSIAPEQVLGAILQAVGPQPVSSS
jgi:lipopolysaccharide heptosyltransferase II